MEVIRHLIASLKRQDILLRWESVRHTNHWLVCLHRCLQRYVTPQIASSTAPSEPRSSANRIEDYAMRFKL